MKYTVTTYFYDNGKVEGSIRPAEDGENSRNESHPRYDVYVDVCDTYEEAKALYDEIEIA